MRIRRRILRPVKLLKSIIRYVPSSTSICCVISKGTGETVNIRKKTNRDPVAHSPYFLDWAPKNLEKMSIPLMLYFVFCQCGPLNQKR